MRIGNIWRLWADIKKEEGIGEEIEKEGVIGRRDNNDREEQKFFLNIGTRRERGRTKRREEGRIAEE